MIALPSVVVVIEGRPQPRRHRFRHHQEQFLGEEDEIEGERVDQRRVDRQRPIPAAGRCRRGLPRRHPADQTDNQRPADQDHQQCYGDDRDVHSDPPVPSTYDDRFPPSAIAPRNAVPSRPRSLYRLSPMATVTMNSSSAPTPTMAPSPALHDAVANSPLFYTMGEFF